MSASTKPVTATAAILVTVLALAGWLSLPTAAHPAPAGGRVLSAAKMSAIAGDGPGAPGYWCTRPYTCDTPFSIGATGCYYCVGDWYRSRCCAVAQSDSTTCFVKTSGVYACDGEYWEASQRTDTFDCGKCNAAQWTHNGNCQLRDESARDSHGVQVNCSN
jgi:hypothetical protein